MPFLFIKYLLKQDLVSNNIAVLRSFLYILDSLQHGSFSETYFHDPLQGNLFIYFFLGQLMVR
jgi:hypothetical protein